jgi:putative membrane protein
MAGKQKQTRLAIIILAILHIVGAIGFVVPQLTELFKQLVPVNLLISLLVLLYFHKPLKPIFFIGILGVMFAGWGIEWVGVETGKIFGQYHYEETLGYKIANVPLMIGVNWFILLYCSLLLAEKVAKPLWVRAILAGFFMVLMDILIEPVAIRYDYWEWETLHVPLQNYIAWFIVSFVMALGFGSLKLKIQNPIALPLYFIQLLFFIVSNILL